MTTRTAGLVGGLERKLGLFAGDRSGAAAVVMAIMIPVLIAGLAFGAEAGYWELQRRKLQNSVDMAARAAAMQKRGGVSANEELKNIAQAVATAGGYSLGDAGIEVTTPPLAGAYAGNPSAVRVTLDESLPRWFTGIFEQTPVTFTVGATALLSGGGEACVLAVAPTGSGAVSIGGSTNILLEGCQLAANSNSPSAVQTTGNAASLEADCVTTVGGVSDSHGVIDYAACDGPNENAPPIADPYAGVPEPAVSGCSAFSTFTSGGNPATPAPGCYTVPSGTNNVNKNVTLQSGGVYVFNGPGEIRLNGNRSMTGTNVTLFLTGGASMKINGGFNLSITAPTSGTYSGIAIFGSRTNGGALDLTGNSGVAVVGAIYAPSSNVTYTGNTSGFTTGQCTQVIGYTVTFWGSAEFDTDCSNSGTTQVVTAQNIQLVE